MPPSLRVLLARQDLTLARWQALACGMTARAWDWRISHIWQQVVPGVAVAHTGGLTDRQRGWAAVLHAGSGACLSGDAALAHYQFRGVDLNRVDALDVAVPGERRPRNARQAGGPLVSCHRVANLELWSRGIRGLPLVTAHAAVLHAAAWASSDRAAEWRVAAVVQQGVSAVPLLRSTLAQMPRLPRRALIRSVLDDVELGAHAASELQLLRFCRAHGLPLPDELQVRVRAGSRTRYVDARYRKQKVSIEVDGAHHRMAGQWEADQLRSLELAVARRGTGEQVIRLTPGGLRHDGPRIADLLRTILT